MLALGVRRRRLRAVVGRVAGGAIAQTSHGTDARRREAIQATLKEVQRKHAVRRNFDLRRALAQSGLDVSPPRFVAISLVGGAVLGLLGLTVSLPLAACTAIVGGLGLPRLVLAFLIRRRRSQFIGAFPEALDIVIRGVRSGLPLAESLHVIGREMREPIGSEFRLVTEGIRVGMTMDESLRRLTERLAATEVRFFAIVVGIQMQTGGNLAETLAKLSEVLRSRKRMRDRIQALSAESKTSALIIGSLPLVVMGILGLIASDYVTVLFTTNPGHLILLVGALVMGAGAFVMSSMINFDI